MEHKSGAKICLADYLSGNPNSLVKPVSSFDSMFTVEIINAIRKTFGFVKTDLSGGPEIKHQYTSIKQVLTNKDVICKLRTIKRPLRGEVACENNSADQKGAFCIR